MKAQTTNMTTVGTMAIIQISIARVVHTLMNVAAVATTKFKEDVLMVKLIRPFVAHYEGIQYKCMRTLNVSGEIQTKEEFSNLWLKAFIEAQTFAKDENLILLKLELNISTTIEDLLAEELKC